MKNNRKAVDDRQLKILTAVKEKGSIRTVDLAKDFNISLMTVRRDLELLEQKNMLVRTHGGAMSLEKSGSSLSKDQLIKKCRDRISAYASNYIESGDRLFINGSLTALNMLEHIHDKSVTVCTNNCHAALEKYPPGVTLMLTGGEIRSNVMVGEYVMRNILNMTADKTFIGCAAVYDDGEFRYDIPTEIGINEAMISRTTKQLYILADHSKVQKRAEHVNSYGSCAYDCPCTFITDDLADKEALEKIQTLGIKVIIVPTGL